MIVTDASVAFKWLKNENEPHYDRVVTLLQNHLTKKEEILIPYLLFIEIANALVTKTEINQKTVEKNLKFLYKLNLKIYQPTAKELLSTAKLAKKYKTSVYDMLYAVVAKANKCNLITADEKFRQKTGFKFIKLLSELEINQPF